MLIRKIEVNAPNTRESKKVEQDTKMSRNNKLGFESILLKLNLYTNEATPHVIRASSVNIYPIISAINLELLNIALKLFYNENSKNFLKDLIIFIAIKQISRD